MKDVRIPVHLHVEGATGIVKITHGKTGVELMKMRCEPAAFGTFTRLDPSGNYEADNYWIGVKPDDGTVFEGELFDPKRRLVIEHAVYRMVGAEPQPVELNWILDEFSTPQCTTYNASTPYGVASIQVHTLTNDDGDCEQHAYARLPWETTSQYATNRLSAAMDYVKTAVSRNN